MPSLSRSFAVVAVAVASSTLFGCARGGSPTGGDEWQFGKDPIVDSVYTQDGWMSLEDSYIPRVCTQENGAAPAEALKAQAIAARTYLLRAMRDDPTLGTPSNPVVNGQGFQTYAPQANAGCVAATQATRGVVGRYQGQLIIANYVAGAIWSDGHPSSDDPTDTEHWVTYNDGLTGSEVHPTALSYTARPDNRGCMSQNGSAALADEGRPYDQILRYFYGADLDLDGGASSSASSGGMGGAPPGGDGAGGAGSYDGSSDYGSYDGSGWSSGGGFGSWPSWDSGSTFTSW
ncbi:MAG TPA: SpoIID/LytB domain-containing protein [Minicystis sp.]|nr:SpoIID/LytB domain-containing protein [Minicystis sp.]